MNMFKLVAKMAAQSPYDSFTATLEELSAEATTAGVDPATFQSHIGNITNFGEVVKSTKASGKSGVGLKVIKADIQNFLRNVTIFNKIADKRLD